MSRSNYDDALAVVGINFRFSKARTNEELWNVLSNSVDVRTKYTKEQLLNNGESPELFNNRDYVPYSVELEDMSCFDAKFFKFSQRFAEMLDPQNRLLLESSWHALEDAGYSPYDIGKEKLVGVFAGKNESQYFFDKLVKDYIGGNSVGDSVEEGHFSTRLEYLTVYLSDFTANWISYKLGLTGPALNVQTGCSTSFSTLAVAYQNLLTYQCDIALVTTSGLNLSHNRGYLYKKNGILSPDGMCRPFDVNSAGTFTGNGIASIVLKRYEDALRDHDHIEALILGVGINNDGNLKQDFMAPGLEGHTNAIKFALERSGLNPADIDFFEAHGTATKLGDSVEIESIKKVFSGGEKRKKPMVIGSVKSNLGHLYTCAGFAGLIKIILSMKHQLIPPTANFTKLNPYIQLEEDEFFINSKSIPWERNEERIRRAGVSSLGFGGTNIHVVLEEPPKDTRQRKLNEEQSFIIFLSATTSRQVFEIKDSWLPFIEKSDVLALEDMSYTSLVGRSHFKVRAAGIINLDPVSNKIKLSKIKPKTIVDKPKSIWMFTGQGAVVSNDFGKELYKNFKAYKEAIDECKGIIGDSLFNEIFPVILNDKNTQVQQPSKLQPKIFIIQYALSKLWLSLGIIPSCVIGHSLGEIAAACVAGILDVKQALELVIARGKAFELVPSGEGNMLVVFTKKDDLPPLFGDVVIAAFNADDILVVSGPKDSIDRYHQICEGKGIVTYPIVVTHAFHSPLMKNVADNLASVVSNLKVKKPSIPIFSTLTGENYKFAMDIDYWSRQIVSPTLFINTLKSAIKEYDITIGLEIGPQSLLSAIAKSIDLEFVPCPKNSKLNQKDFLVAVGQLYEHGFIPMAENIFSNEVKRSSLPGYPFERKSYWIDKEKHNTPKKNEMNHVDTQDADKMQITSNDREELFSLLQEYWVACLGNSDINGADDFFSLGGTSLIAIKIIDRINKDLEIDIKIETFMQGRNLENLTEIVLAELVKN